MEAMEIAEIMEVMGVMAINYPGEIQPAQFIY
jgi:hypothetical protein